MKKGQFSKLSEYSVDGCQMKALLTAKMMQVIVFYFERPYPYNFEYWCVTFDLGLQKLIKAVIGDTFSKYKKLCGAYGQGHHMKWKQFGFKDKDGLYHIMHSLKYIIHKYIVNLSR